MTDKKIHDAHGFVDHINKLYGGAEAKKARIMASEALYLLDAMLEFLNKHSEQTLLMHRELLLHGTGQLTRVLCKVKKTGRVFYPDIINYYTLEVTDDASMDDIVGSIKYSFDEVELYVDLVDSRKDGQIRQKT